MNHNLTIKIKMMIHNSKMRIRRKVKMEMNNNNWQALIKY